MPRSLVIGAGMAGLTCARVLRDAGHDVSVLDKARGPGGRASTRRAPEGGYDHGVQYFTAREPDFEGAVAAWVRAGAAAVWEGRIGNLEAGRILEPRDGVVRYVGAPRMSALWRWLAEGLPVDFGRRAKQVRMERDGWHVACEDGATLGPFDLVVVATPSPQALPLLEAVPELASRAAEAEVDPCWAVMAAFTAPLALPLDGLFVADSPVAWASRDSSKPGRAEGERWVLQATPAWSSAHVDASTDEVSAALLEAFADAAAVALPEVLHRDAHRWLYAKTRRSLGVPYLYDEARGIAACGDYCLGGRIEAAWLSGRALGDRLAARR